MIEFERKASHSPKELDRAAPEPYAYLAKPFTTDGLARKVYEALDALTQRS